MEVVLSLVIALAVGFGLGVTFSTAVHTIFSGVEKRLAALEASVKADIKKI